ncbi:MAG: hypothetical protein RIG62_11475 [Cyclobacteriaceae bacterium]
MKNWFPTLLGAGVIASGLALSSCEDEFTEADAIALQDSTLTALKKLDNDNAIALDKLDWEQQMAYDAWADSLERIGPVVNYSVTVVAGGNVNTNARTEGESFAEGAMVTVVQGGVSREETTSAGGVATFGDLRIGEAVVTVQATDHTTVTYTTILGYPNSGISEDNVGTLIPIFPTTLAGGASEVSGIAWAELDLTNDEPEFAEGAVVRATISVGDMFDDYDINHGYSDKGIIRTASYSNFVVTDTVDAEGRYSLVIPNGNADDGNGIDVRVEFLPFETEQTFLAWQGDSLAVVTKDVIFESTGTSNDDDHLDYDLPSVWLEIGAPTGTASGLELSITKVRDDLNTYDVELDAVGKDYIVGDLFNFSADADDNVAQLRVTGVDFNGSITSYTIDDNGATYDAAPTLTQDGAASGTGATFLSTYYTDYEVTIANGGSGYWDEPEMVVTYDYYDNGTLVKDAYDDNLDIDILAGKIKADDADGVVYTISSVTTPKFDILPLEARQAVIDLEDYFINDQNRIEGSDDEFYIYFDGGDSDNGSGYITNPTVTFKSVGSMGSGATGVAYVEDGYIDYITITNPGSGYMGEVNDYTYSVAASASQSASKQFKPASSNPNYNFNFGSGVVKQ